MATADPSHRPGAADYDRIHARADDRPAEEAGAGSADPAAQAAAILADSDERQEGRDESGAVVEPRSPAP